MKKSIAVFLLVTGVTTALLSGCAAKTTTADLMRGHATEIQTQVDMKKKLAKDWEQGSSLVQSGKKRVSDGEKQVKKGEDQVKRGQAQIKKGQDQVKKGEELINRGSQEIANGTKLVQESEQLFRDNFPDLELNLAQ